MWSSKYLSSLGEAFFTYSILMIQQASNERWFFCFPLGWQGTMEQAFVCTYVGCMHAKSLQSCLILCDLWMVACQVPLSMGFSRQEYWSGLPCPPPGESSQSRDWPMLLCPLHWQMGSLSLVPPRKPQSVSCSVVSDSLQLIDCGPPDSFVDVILQAGILEWVAMPSSRGSSSLRNQTQVSFIAARFLTFTIWATRKSTMWVACGYIRVCTCYPLPSLSEMVPCALVSITCASWGSWCLAVVGIATWGTWIVGSSAASGVSWFSVSTTAGGGGGWRGARIPVPLPYLGSSYL